MKLFINNFYKYRKYLNGKAGVYQILNISNGKKYIGSSNNIYLRLYNHISKLKLGKHSNLYLQNAFNNVEKDCFEFVILKYSWEISLESLIKLEQQYLDTVSPEYNIQPLAYLNRGYKHTPEAIEKIRLSGIGRKTNNKAVLQYTKCGKYVREWESFAEIGKTLPINSWNIKSCCKYYLYEGNYKYSRKTAGGYIWKYKE